MNIKNAFIAICFLFLIPVFCYSQNYELLIYDVDYHKAIANPSEWACWIHADLFDNGHYVEPQPNFQYQWWLNMGQGWFQTGTNNPCYRDGLMDSTYYTYVVLTFGTQVITSNTIPIGAEDSSDLYRDTELEVDQKRQDNTTIGEIAIRRRINQAFLFRWYPAPWTTRLNYGWQYLTSDTMIYSSPNEKYHDWENEQDIKNYHRVLIDTTTDLLTSNFDKIYSAAVDIDLLSGGSGGAFDFKDPWLRDSISSIGILNRGNEAVWKSAIDQLDLSLDSPHQGVFLNQDFNIPGNPYYTVRAPQQDFEINGKMITWDWESWSYDPAEIALQSPNNNTTAVVFKDADATLTANLKGRRLSDTRQATAGNNGFKLTPAKFLYLYPIPQLIYEDRGYIYWTRLNDELTAWEKDWRLSDPDENHIDSAPCISPMEQIAGNGMSDHSIFAWDSYDPVSQSYSLQAGYAYRTAIMNFPRRIFPGFSVDFPQRPSVAGYIKANYTPSAVAA